MPPASDRTHEHSTLGPFSHAHPTPSAPPPSVCIPHNTSHSWRVRFLSQQSQDRTMKICVWLFLVSTAQTWAVTEVISVSGLNTLYSGDLGYFDHTATSDGYLQKLSMEATMIYSSGMWWNDFAISFRNSLRDCEVSWGGYTASSAHPLDSNRILPGDVAVLHHSAHCPQ